MFVIIINTEWIYINIYVYNILCILNGYILTVLFV